MMECPSCNTQLQDATAYCTRCGSPVPATSPGRGSEPVITRRCFSCNAANGPVSRYCTACGASLYSTESPSLPPVSGSDERRTVTVLHADVCGFTRLVERLNPEETRQLIDALFRQLSRDIAQWGGKVEGYIGDAILAVFGVPIAHGDDPLRAVQAALALHNTVKVFSHPLLARSEPVRIRVGIDCGPVVVGRIGATSRSTVTGAAVSNAMDLEREAPVGGTLISEAVRSLLPARISLQARALSSGRSAYELLERTPMTPEALQDWTQEILDPGAVLQPETVDPQAILDRLSAEHRRLLKGAAVIGPHFWVELLERLGFVSLPNTLAELTEAGLIELSENPRLSGTVEYRFTSEPLRRTAYDTTLMKVRRFTHRVVADWLDERGDSSIAMAAVQTWHRLEGGEPAAAVRLLLNTLNRLNSAPDAELGAQLEEILRRLEATEALPEEAAQQLISCQLLWKGLQTASPEVA